MNFKINEDNINLEFIRLSNSFLLEKRLKVNDKVIRFTEIEFYLYSKNHDDGFTHKHDYNAGKWRFHNQGFDITLRSTSGFGCILIRGIEVDGKYINGPRRVIFEIMKYLKPVTEINNEFGIIHGKGLDLRVFRTFRHGLTQPKLPCQYPELYKQAKYRFIVNPQEFDKKQFKGSEKIAKSFNDKKLSSEFLGYKLTS